MRIKSNIQRWFDCYLRHSIFMWTLKYLFCSDYRNLQILYLSGRTSATPERRCTTGTHLCIQVFLLNGRNCFRGAIGFSKETHIFCILQNVYSIIWTRWSRRCRRWSTYITNSWVLFSQHRNDLWKKRKSNYAWSKWANHAKHAKWNEMYKVENFPPNHIHSPFIRFPLTFHLCSLARTHGCFSN